MVPSLETIPSYLNRRLMKRGWCTNTLDSIEFCFSKKKVQIGSGKPMRTSYDVIQHH
jgi:hypothetical protein